jgi:hypothetical protein
VEGGEAARGLVEGVVAARDHDQVVLLDAPGHAVAGHGRPVGHELPDAREDVEAIDGGDERVVEVSAPEHIQVLSHLGTHVAIALAKHRGDDGPGGLLRREVAGEVVDQRAVAEERVCRGIDNIANLIAGTSASQVNARALVVVEKTLGKGDGDHVGGVVRHLPHVVEADELNILVIVLFGPLH